MDNGLQALKWTPEQDGSPAIATLPYNGGEIRFQQGPVKENGRNGAQVEDVIAVAISRLEGFQQGPFESVYNKTAIWHLQRAVESLNLRTRERTARGVEGQNIV